MNDWITVNGMVLSAMPIGEYDRRVLLLTAELGKISAFIRGGRKTTSPLLGAGRLFAFGRFELYAGRNAYTVKSAEILEYFEFLTADPEAVCYASYFSELAAYYGQEGSEDPALLRLLFHAVRSLRNEKLERPVIRYAYELKLIQTEGEAAPDPLTEVGESAEKAWHYVLKTESEKCFLFRLEPAGFRDFARAVAGLRNQMIDHSFKSLSVLEDFLSMKAMAERQAQEKKAAEEN